MYRAVEKYKMQGFKKIGLKLLLVIVFILILPIGSVIRRHEADEDLENLYRALSTMDRREQSLEKFTKYGKRGGDYLISRIAMEKDNLIKADVIQMIGHVGCTSCGEQLIAFLSDPDWRVRYFTIDTIARLPDVYIAPILRLVIVNDMNENVKSKAIMTLGKCGNDKDVAFLNSLSSNAKFRGDKCSKAIDVALGTLRGDGGAEK